jgi:hypothetical protein
MPTKIRSAPLLRSSLTAALALFAMPAFAQSLSLLDARVVEGNSGGSLLLFEARLSAPASGNVTFDFATSDGSAVAGSDYAAQALTGLSIPAGQTSLKIAVTAVGDASVEANEFLNATVTNVAGATLATGSAKGLIVNDDHLLLATAPADPAAQSGSTGYATEETSVSRDGRFVAFTAVAQDLVGAGRPVNNFKNVYVRDNRTGTTTLASVATNGGDANGDSSYARLSADGRYVVFQSAASNLVANDFNSGTDVFRRDLQTGAIELVSANHDGTGPASGYSTKGSPSADGRYIAFQSTAFDVVAVDTNNTPDAFVRDMQAGTNTLVSVGPDGIDSHPGGAWSPSLSADGRYVAFDRGSDIWRRDMLTGQFTQVTVNVFGRTPNSTSYNAGISADGRYVVFSSWATDFGTPVSAMMPQVYRRDVQLGTTELVSYTYNNDAALDSPVYRPSMSADGQNIAFQTYDRATMDDGDSNVDVFVRSMPGRYNLKVSKGWNGGSANGISEFASLSADGQFVAFVSTGTALLPGDGNGQPDVFRAEMVNQGYPELYLTDTTVIEGDSGIRQVNYTISVPFQQMFPVTFDLATGDGSAIAGSDYVARTWTGLTIPAGQSSITVTLDILSDVVSEGYEGFNLYLTNLSGARADDTQAMVLIANDDAPPPPSLSIGDVTVAEGNSGTTLATFTVTLSAPASSPITFDVATANGTAVAGSDYAATSLTGLWIPAGSTSATFTVAINGDGVVEGNETFLVDVANVMGATTADGHAVGTIQNDDAYPSLAIGDVSVLEGNSGTTLATFTVTLSAAAATPVTFDVATANGTAVAGSDYVATALTGLTIATGSSSRTFTVAVNGDGVVEANETFLVNVGNVAGAIVADGQATGTIQNDDAFPSLTIGDVSVFEGNSGTALATFTVQLSKVAASPVTFDIATANGTATAGSDYVARSLTGQAIPAGASSATFTVTVNADTTVEPNETFQVNVGNVAGATVLDGQALGTIRNDDQPSLSIADVTVAEGNGGTTLATFTVQLSGAANTVVTYDIATANGTAAAPGDYTPKALTLQQIPIGATSATFTVSINGDAVREADETFLVNVGNVVGADVGDGSATGTVTNDDAQPSLSIADVSMTEGLNGTKTFTFTVSLSYFATGPVSYNIATANGTAAAPGDYSAGSASNQVIPAGGLAKTFSVSVKGDKQVEANETFLVNVSNVAGAIVADGQAVGTIVNDDGATLSLSRVTTGGLYDDIDDRRGEPVLTGREYALLLQDAAKQVCARGGGTALVGIDGVESLAVLADLADAANLLCPRQPQYRAAMKANGLGFLVDGVAGTAQARGTQVLDVAALGAHAQGTAITVQAEGHAAPLTVLLAATPPVDRNERAAQAREFNRLVRAKFAAEPRARVVVLGAGGLEGLVDLTARALPPGAKAGERVWVSAAVLEDFGNVRLDLPSQAQPASQVLQLQP